MTREYHSLKRERDRLLHYIESHPQIGVRGAMRLLVRAEQISQRMREIQRGEIKAA